MKGGLVVTWSHNSSISKILPLSLHFTAQHCEHAQYLVGVCENRDADKDRDVQLWRRVH